MTKKIQTIQNDTSYEDPPSNRSKLGNLTYKHLSLSFKSIITLLLLTIFQTANAQTQVLINSAQIQLDESQVSSVTNGTLEILRQNSGPSWQPNQCFVLWVGSPYNEPKQYQTFRYSSPPNCISLTQGIVVANCTVVQQDTLSFVLSQVNTSAAFSQSIRIQITQFYTPFSSQIIKQINLRSYSDPSCNLGLKTIQIPAITTQIAILPVSRVNLTSTSNVLGNATSSNSLIVKFTPLTTMTPSGSGSIQIGVPYWYQIGQTGERMYSGIAQKRCSSPCMRIFYSQLQNDKIVIRYDNMVPSCISGTEIVITCRQFFNPITPDIITGFSLSTYDDEIDQRVIEQTIQNLTFDATQFLPATIPLQNFKIDPANNTVSTFSMWTIALSVNIPLEVQCYIRFYLPPEFVYRPLDMQASGIFIRPDLSSTVNLTDIQVIYRTTDGKIPKSSVVFPGCNDIQSLGSQPSGRIYISDISIPNSVMDSASFEVTIYKDKALTKKIAVLDAGAILPGSNISPGLLKNISIVPADRRVQRITNLKISFTTSTILAEGAATQITLPSGLSIPNQSQVIVTLSNGTSVTPNITNGQIILIPNIVPQGKSLPPNSNISFTINGIKNQNSAQDAGSFTIQTMQLYNGAYFVADRLNSNISYNATVGKIIPVGNIVVDNPANQAKRSLYNITFIVEDQVPMAGQIRVNIPSEITLQPSSTASLGSCKVYLCTYVDTNVVQILFANGIAAGSQQSIIIGGATNPRSFKPTGQFTVISLDIDGVSQIDTGYNQTAVMTIAGLMNSLTATPTSVVNGDVNTYRFTSQNQIPIVAGDQLQITLPQEITAPVNSKAMNCTALINVQSITCSVSGQTMTILFNKFDSGSQAFTFSISGIQNPPSIRPSNTIASKFLDNSGFIVSENSDIQNPVRITNRQPAQLIVYGINQTSIINSEITTYELSFKPVNPLGVQSSISIQYPSQVELQIGQTTCVVKTAVGVYSQNCVIQASSRTITIQNVIPGPNVYSELINITLTSVKNPANNRPTSGFVIQTYSDQALTFIQDKLGDFLLQPQFPCNYPCQSCGTDKSVCDTCWQTQGDPNFLMFYPNGTITCRPYCEAGFTTNGNTAKNCTACDVSCSTCVDNFTQGDLNLCTNCAPNYPFKLSQTQTCLKQCRLGEFQSAVNTCAKCKDPCRGCSGSERSCTQCFQDRPGFPTNLFFDTCIDVCPVGYVSMSGICTKCKSPCQTCSGSPENCDSCDGSGNTKFIYQKRCYAQCPDGSAPNSTDQTCLTCNPGCDLCDIVNKTMCLKCTRPTVAYQGDCLDKCPDGWHIDIPPNDGRACRPWQLGDLGTLPYPFLIAGLIFTIICLLGLLKKRAFLSHGKMQMMSPQNTLTCIIVALAPLQFLATIVQWILSYVYGTSIFTILALVVTIAAIIINIAFQHSFHRRFDTVVIPLSYERRVRLGKMTRIEAMKYQVPRDENFNLFKRQNKGTAYTIYSMTLSMTWKFNKLFYSFFYDLKIFQAQFSDANFYRKMMMTYYVIGVICIDLTLICIDITALTKIESGNQLYITLQETLILSILNIILGSIELFNIKNSMKYTEIKKQKKLKIKSAGEDSEDSYSYKDLDAKFDKGKMTERRLLMNDLLKHVKHNKQLFLNNKLDELLQDFGERKCKSMLDLGTGWHLEDDPRLVITWPVSPMLKDDFAEMGDFKFTKDDAYGLQGNNVYADAKSKFMGMDFGIQEDAGFLEFQDALNRKHGGLMSQQDGEIEERRIKKQKRRRGRKNKYYTQIDHEDDQEAENAEANDAKDDLQVIKEQEEQEELLRKAIAQEAIKHQELANQRKKLLDEANQAKQAQEVKEAQERKQRAIDIENASRAKIQADAELLAKQEIQSKKLQEQYAIEIKQRQAEEKLKAEQAAIKSAQLREEYDRQDASRLRKLNEEKVKLLAEEEEQNKIQLELDRIEREQKIKDTLQAQADKDARELQENLERTKAIDAQRALDKQNAKLGLDQSRVQSPVKAENNTQVIDVPPKAQLRTFNECDILGDLDRDEQGNVVVLKDTNGIYQDKLGNLTNQKGYLLNSITEAVIENVTHQEMFTKSQLDNKGEIPAPFCIEKFNFNPHDLIGDFDLVDGQRQLLKSSQGFFMDKNGRRVNKFGWLTLAGQGHLVDVSGRKKFDKTQLQQDGNLPKLFNYQGKRFDIQDVMGALGKDSNNRISPQNSNQGLVDQLGRRVTAKGYLTDAAGNIIDKNGKQIWRSCELKNGEFPKIFTFTKFNIKQIQGDFEIGPNNNPTLAKGTQGGFVDRQKRQTNQRGYLVDKQGNLIDSKGNLVFYSEVLGQDGEIPPVFRTGVLTSEVVSDLSNMIAEFEQGHLKGGEASMDSQMDDMAANYENTNNGFGNGEQTEDQEDFLNNDLQSNGAPNTQVKKKSKKKSSKVTKIEVLQPTVRDKNLAGAYGGEAVGSIRRQGVKYDKERLKGSQKFRVSTADEPKLRSTIAQFVQSPSGTQMMDMAIARKTIGDEPFAQHQGLMGETIQQHSNDGKQTQIKKGADQVAQIDRERNKQKRPGMQDFEQIFGKDIDQFLEDSQWDLRSQENGSQGSGKNMPGTANSKRIKQLEQQYSKASPK